MVVQRLWKHPSGQESPEELNPDEYIFPEHLEPQLNRIEKGIFECDRKLDLNLRMFFGLFLVAGNIHELANPNGIVSKVALYYHILHFFSLIFLSKQFNDKYIVAGKDYKQELRRFPFYWWSFETHNRQVLTELFFLHTIFIFLTPFATFVNKLRYLGELAFIFRTNYRDVELLRTIIEYKVEAERVLTQQILNQNQGRSGVVDQKNVGRVQNGTRRNRRH